ncbi:MAG TPA: site-specific integrase [Xanthobacteraceae bacterium]|nr:site-specific integrase [Xanthobacteraceae bacterium]
MMDESECRGLRGFRKENAGCGVCRQKCGTDMLVALQNSAKLQRFQLVRHRPQRSDVTASSCVRKLQTLRRPAKNPRFIGVSSWHAAPIAAVLHHCAGKFVGGDVGTRTTEGKIKMAINKLTARFVETVKKNGTYGDGGGLSLQVGSSGQAKSWIFRYVTHGSKPRMMGLGSFNTIGLAEARDRARECRQQVHDGIDPIEAREESQVAVRLEAHRKKTFQECAEEWFNAHESSWAPLTARFIQARLDKHVNSKIGSLPVHLVDEDRVHEVIKPLWQARSQDPKQAGISTAKELLQYIKRILDFATVKKYRKGNNPAAWSSISALLPDAKKILTPKHHAALPFREIGPFMAELRASRDARFSGAERPMPAYLLEFIILTAVRIGEAILAKWDEIDLEARVWTCPAQRTKTGKRSGKPHEVFLNAPAMQILRAMQAMQEQEGTAGEYVFVHRLTRDPRARQHVHMTGKTFHHEAPSVFLRGRLQRPDLTTHGFRTTFRSWARQNGFDHIASEMALDHAVGNTVSEIYARQADMIEQRRLLMDAWGAYCDRPEPLDAKIIPMRSAKSAK